MYLRCEQGASVCCSPLEPWPPSCWTESCLAQLVPRNLVAVPNQELLGAGAAGAGVMCTPGDPWEGCPFAITPPATAASPPQMHLYCT